MTSEKLLEQFESEMQERQKEVKKDRLKLKKFGAIYTPAEMVDFTIKSTCEELQRKHGVSIDHPRVQVLDPFTGTGNFLWRALLIRKEDGTYLMERNNLESKVRGGFFIGMEINYESLKIAKRNVDIALEFRLGRKLEWRHAICTDTFILQPDTDIVQLVRDNEHSRTKDGIVVIPPGDEDHLKNFLWMNEGLL